MEYTGVAVIGGGQSGLATAHALLRRGLRPVALEASGRAAGPWPHSCDSRTLFPPARYSPLPGTPFPGADGTESVRPDGQREEADATDLDGALGAEGTPRHREDLATAVPGLAFVGPEWQRSLSSNSLRGVGRDAERITRRLAARLARR